MTFGDSFEGFLNWEYGSVNNNDQFPSIPFAPTENVISANLLASTAIVFNPNVAQVIVANVISSTNVFYNADVVLVIQPTRIESTNLFYNATISQPFDTIDCNLIASTNTFYLADITQTLDTTITADPWIVSTVIPLATISQPFDTVVAELIGFTSIVFNPTIEGPPRDTSDILDRGAYRRRRDEEIYEENIAAQMLRKRRYDAEQKKKKKKSAKSKFESLVMQIAPEFRSTKQKRIKALLLLATLED